MKTINYYKKIFIGVLLIAPLASGLFSCKKKKEDTPSPDSGAHQTNTTIIQGEITSNTHWTADQHYLLKGWVYVVDGVTLTIDPGTVIKGDKASKGTLIIERGAKLNAIGTAAAPIIFTSNESVGNRNYGDWGGVILCGKATNNWIAANHNDGTSGTLSAGIGQVEGGPRTLYGGTDDTDNSGTLQYVRIEFGGVAFSPNNEVNGLTLCSVGNGTTIDHIQVSYSGDDSYEFFGGSVNCKYMICHRGWDDDFDMDNGYHGNIQFGMIMRDPYAADASGSHSIECDSRNENNTGILTNAVLSNITALGPLVVNPASTNYSPNFVCGAIMRRAGAASIMNSLIIGYPSGVIIEDDATYGLTTTNIQDSTLQIANTAFIATPTIGQVLLVHRNDSHGSPNAVTAASTVSDTATSSLFGSSAGPYTWAAALKDKIYAQEGTSSKLYNAFTLTAPNLLPTTGSIVVFPVGNPAVKASFSSSKFTGNSFMDKTANYVGAFNTDNWTTGWANFDPQNADYGSAY